MKTAYSTGSLTQVRPTVTNIRAAVEDCRNAYVALQNWATAVNNYNAGRWPWPNKPKKPTNKHPQAARAAGRRGGDVPVVGGVRHPGQCPGADRAGVLLTGGAGSRDAVRPW